MAKYLITYHGAPMPNDPAVMEKVKEAFGKWLQEAGKAVTDPGAPIKMVDQVSNDTPSKAAEIGGYSIIEVPSKEEAVRLLKSHPFVQRGGTLQINEVFSV